MHDDPIDGGLEAALAAIEAELEVIEEACRAIETEAGARCEACGTGGRAGDPILCRVCGEAVLDDGRAP